MALPQQVVERLMQETPKTPGWSAELLSFGIAIFAISVVIYIGIALGYQPYTNGQIKKLDNQIALFEQQVPASEQQQIAAFYSQLINVNTTLGSRNTVLPFFSWFEQHTETNVFFGATTLDLTENKLTLSGTAKSVDDVAYASRIFEQDPEVTNVVVGSVNAESPQEGVQFSMTISFARGFFKVAPTPSSPSPSTP